MQVIPWVFNMYGRNPLAKARGLSPRTDGQIKVRILFPNHVRHKIA